MKPFGATPTISNRSFPMRKVLPTTSGARASRRVQKSSASGTTNYPYDGDNPLEEVDASGDSLARYTQGRGPDEPLAELRSGATSYYEADDLGTIASLSNSAGALANTYTYDTFGNLAASTGCNLAPRSAQRFVGFPI